MSREEYARETQMFQRIAGVEETPLQELMIEYDSWKKDRQKRSVKSIQEHRMIQDVAIRSAKERTS